ncbi:hypothetical protein B9Z55_023700 [Caenorhabditis nigoni]|uniref:Uncharacterized protein n=1 Tax=Caenorhabditis nigoni TaxID=1611254 RepID=A0A2G5SRB0_9PELO|nr:hypothetical protein B9Z55_023700 [Caenorhabditis nigoni]
MPPFRAPTTLAPTTPEPTTLAPPPVAYYGPASSNAPFPRPVGSFEEALEDWNNWNGRDQAIDGIDLKEYLFHPHNGHYVPQIVRRVRDSFRSLSELSYLFMKRYRLA